MVARISTGKNIRGIVNYNERKVEKGKAEFLMAQGFLKSEKQLTFSDKLRRFEELTQKNQRTQTNAMHVSLNFSKEDELDPEKLTQIARAYMNGIGFGDQPFLVYQHHDAAHPHIHIVTTNITSKGKRLETHNIGKGTSEKTRRKIEEQFNLIRAENQKKEKEYVLAPLTKAHYGKAETKAAISNVVREIIRSHQFTSLAELNAILRQFNVIAHQGEEGSRMYQRKGLVYSICDEQGNKQGVPIKASSIYSSPTLTHLEEKFNRNKEKRKANKPRLKRVVDKALQESNSTQSFAEHLKRKGV